MREEELLAHGEFIRGLARRLIPDDFWAADVAQQTFAAALEYPPSEEKPLGAWLATVTHNFARKLYRKESVRGAKERAYDQKAYIPSTASVVEREEIRRTVVDAVLALSDPYRTTLLLRFYEELSPREVARRMEVPVETVRTRVKRGLEQLRGRLDHLHGGDRKQWCLALAPLAGAKFAASSAAAAAGLASAGAAWLTAPVKAGIAALVILGLSWTLFWMWPENRELEPPGRHDSTPALVRMGDEEEPVIPETAEERGAVEITADRGERVALAPEANRVLEGVVIHQESKRPLAGLNIRIFEHNYSLRHPSEYLETTTGPEGRFEFRGIPWAECDVWLHDENYFCPFNEHVSFRKTERPEPLVLSAQPGTYLLIRVLGTDGKPEPLARLGIGKKKGGSLTTQAPFICNDEGVFFLNQGVEAGTTVAVVARGAKSAGLSKVAFVRPRTDEANEITLRLEGGPPIKGRVVGPDGKPMAGVQVRPLVLCPEESGFNTLHIPEFHVPRDFYAEHPANDQVFTDPEGRFTMEGLAPGAYRLTAKPEDFEQAVADVIVGPNGSTRPKAIVLNLKQALMVRGRAVDEEGCAVTGTDGACGFFYHHEAATSRIVKYSIDCDHDDGSFKFPSNRIFTNVAMAGGDRVDFVVVAPGYVPFMMRDVAPGGEEIQAVLKRGASVTGRVLSSVDRVPLRSFRITRSMEEYALAPDAFFYHCHSGDPWVQRFEDNGEFFNFTGLEPGDHRLLVEADGYTAERIDLNIPPSSRPIEDLEIVLHPCLSIEGRVLRAETEESLIQADVTACLLEEGFSDDMRPVTFYSDGLRTIKTVQTDAAGRFKLTGLEPGSYRLQVSTDRMSSGSQAFGPFEVRPGKEQEEVTLRVEAPTARVVVHVKDRDGRPAGAGARVDCARPPDFDDGSDSVYGQTDDQGIARLEGVRSGRRMLHVRLEDENHAWWTTREIEVLPRGETLVTVQEPGGGAGATIRGKVLKRGVPCPGIELYFSTTEDRSRCERVVTDANGAFAFQGVLPGTYDIHGPDRRGLFIQVEEGDRLIEKNIILGTYRIAGTIRTRDGKPLHDALGMLVECYDESGRQSPGYALRTGTAARDGRFEIDYLEEGRYALYAWLRIGDAFYSGLLRNVEAWDERMDRMVSVTLDPACEIRLVVPEGRYSGWNDIRLFYLLDRGIEIEVRGVMIIPETMGGNRIIRHRRLLPGAYRIDFRTPSGAVESRRVEIQSGEVKEVRAP
jgi:RNA polymerase sigma-70 factor (ECF subfamily)